MQNNSEELLAGGSSRRANKAVTTASGSITRNRSLKAVLQVGALILTVSAIPARADVILNTLDFTGLQTDTDAQIQTYIQTTLGSAVVAGSVKVTGAEGGGAPCGSSVSDCYGGLHNGHYYYTGDGHVVGGTSRTSTSYTLANKDGGFIINNNGVGNSQGSPSSYINLQFTLTGGATEITGLSFDYEIFPNIDCGTRSNCADISLTSGVGGSTDWSKSATNPASGSYSPCGTNDSPSSETSGCSSGLENNAQLIGTFNSSGTLTTAQLDSFCTGGVCDITFNDWPATIGIEDVVITTNTDPVPEPSSLILLGTIAGLVVFKMRRRVQA